MAYSPKKTGFLPMWGAAPHIGKNLSLYCGEIEGYTTG